MKSTFNKAVHKLLRLTQTSVRITDAERDSYLERAQQTARDISKWLGETEHEKVGLGQNCNASWYLKATGKKRASYPFDWIFTTPEIIEDMLHDNFEAFLNPDQLIPHGIDAGHERYHEWLFGHRNPARSHSDRDFFKRCVTRWNELISSQIPILFITVVLNEPEKRKRWRKGFSKQFVLPTDQKPSDFKPMMDRVSRIHPQCKFLFIEQYTGKPFELSVIDKNEQSYWLRFSSVGSNSGVQYLNNVDDEVMKTILKNS